MSSYNRDLSHTIRARLDEPTPLIQVVIGPRQVGKTTALKSALGPVGIYHSADYPTPTPSEQLVSWWEEAAHDDSRLLAVDEIQKVVNWSETVKYLWDRSVGMKVVLTGSSALLVEKGLSETLAGRYEVIRAEHWNFAEAQRVFQLSLRDYVEFGCYPGSIRFLEDRVRWASYVRDSIVEPAIGRDLLQLHPVKNPALLRQVFGAAVAMPSQIVSMQKLTGSLQERGSVPTISHYLKLLSQGFLVSALEKYTVAALRSKSSIPKLIVHDNALCRAFERPVLDPIGAERFGRYFENLVGARFLEAGWETYYWSERNREVDFIVKGPQGQKWAVEVKAGPTSQSELKTLTEFCKNHPDFEPKLVSFQNQKVASIDTLEVEDVLSLKA